jgi:predicted nucleotidyltransferase component of viral defense system
MDRIACAPDHERKNLFIEVSDKLSINDFIVEKDFWVSWVLGKIFYDDELSNILCFKGGTSLSKAFGLIDRFSEDIDIILSQSVVLNEGEVLEQPSNSKQINFNKIVEKRAEDYIKTELKENISKALGEICSVNSDNDDGHILNINFPRVFDYSYIQPDIKLEVGPLALWNPNERYPISSFIARVLPELELEIPLVPTIKPERTFWEKITILHQEHHRPKSLPLQQRYSRHYYDVYKMGNSKVKAGALADIALLKEVVDFKKRFYPRAWAEYEKAIPGSICLLPTEHNSEILVKDYERMKNMIFGEVPSWDTILTGLHELECAINKRK